MHLSLQGLSKRYGTLRALDAVDLEVASGELLALLGPSGSGKTTLLRAIAGLVPIDAGRLRFGDIDATDLPLRERRVGFVFQHYALFRHMRVAANVAFGLQSLPRRQRPPAAEIARRVEALLERMQLSGLGGRYPDQLSGGQRQRVALARALAIQPRLLLLDEPFGALDAQVRIDLRRWLREVHEQTGHTTLFVTHDQEEALELADRVAVFRDGRIEQVGTPDEVYRAPRTPFVFEFIGRGGHLEGHAEEGVLHLPGCGVGLPLATAAAGRLRLHLRPQDLELVAPDEGLPAEVRAARRIGARQTVDVAVPGQSGVLEVDLDPGLRLPARGERVGLRVTGGLAFPVPSEP
ncbi:MAG: sulfate/molybdate ABC transporter ATP-binding protein [Xanthomonadaceae bacterium]|jgi:sulfate transport system ATP-binding protein|nr:sulfate/molybdate ABC transporter ATP-binding protein [Xanthomonadaceae bacterium]